MTNTNVIHVAYALDDNYTEFTCVSMTSLLHNTKRPVHFHVLENRLSEENKQILRDIGLRYPHGQWTFYHVESDESFVVDSKDHVSMETYFRLYLPKLLINLEKVLWIDSDTVIDKTIDELFDIDVIGYYAAVVPDNVLNNDYQRKILLNIPNKDIYFNAGVLLINIKEVKKINLFDISRKISRIWYYKSEKSNVIFFHDQDLLNCIFAGNVRYLPWKFNFMYILDIGSGDISSSFSLSEAIEAITNPVVVHFHGDYLRPIAELSTGPIYSINWRKWYKYKALTVYANENDHKRIEKYEERLRLSDSSIILPYAYIALKRYSIFGCVANIIASMLKGRNVVVWGYNIHTRLLIAVITAHGVNVGAVVDGMVDNQLIKVFDNLTESPEMLRGNSSKYFVLLDMNSDKTANKVASVLDEYGYSEADFYYVYKPLYKVINGETE